MKRTFMFSLLVVGLIGFGCDKSENPVSALAAPAERLQVGSLKFGGPVKNAGVSGLAGEIELQGTVAFSIQSVALRKGIAKMYDVGLTTEAELISLHEEERYHASASSTDRIAVTSGSSAFITKSLEIAGMDSDVRLNIAFDFDGSMLQYLRAWISTAN